MWGPRPRDIRKIRIFKDFMLFPGRIFYPDILIATHGIGRVAINSWIHRLKGHRLFFCLGAPQRWAADCGGRSTSTWSITFRLPCWLSQWTSCTIKIFAEAARPPPPRPITPQPTVRGAKHQQLYRVSISVPNPKFTFFLHHSPFHIIVILGAADQHSGSNTDNKNEQRQRTRQQQQQQQQQQTASQHTRHTTDHQPSRYLRAQLGGYK